MSTTPYKWSDPQWLADRIAAMARDIATGQVKGGSAVVSAGRISDYADELVKAAADVATPICGDPEHRHTGPCHLWARPVPAADTATEADYPEPETGSLIAAAIRRSDNIHGTYEGNREALRNAVAAYRALLDVPAADTDTEDGTDG